jgi:predicted nucleotidyltransferase
MKRLPEKIRKTLEKITKEMKVEEDKYGVGLFGSWSRGDATRSSDVDLLVLQKGSLSNEFVKRTEINGLFIDLDYIPKKWIPGPTPPRLDQKIHEMKILYDRDWSLTNTKLMMAKTYSSPERVEIRTKAHIVESDIYLSRATSAFSRKDFQSAQLFATIALENILRIFMEIALQPFSKSRFIQSLISSTTKLGKHNIFDEYLQITSLDRADDASAKDKLKLFKAIWDEMHFTAKRNLEFLESSHFRIKIQLKYYLNQAFLQGMIMRTKSLIDSGKAIEATHYLNNVLVDMIQNYIWLKSSVANVKVDYTTLIRSLETLEEKNSKNHKNIVTFLNLRNLDKPTSASTIEATRDVVLNTRAERKLLIKNHLLTS